MGGRGRASGDGGRERCRGGGETGKGKASRLDREPAGQTEGNESLDGPRRAVRGAGVPEGRGGRVSARARSCQPEGPGSRRPPAGRGMGEKPRQADGLMDGLTLWGLERVGGDVDTLDLRSPFSPEVEFFCLIVFVFVFLERCEVRGGHCSIQGEACLSWPRKSP